MKFVLHPIGWIRKTKTTTRIVLYKKYQTGLMGFENLSETWALWWFDRNDTPRMRSTRAIIASGSRKAPVRAPVLLSLRGSHRLHFLIHWHMDTSSLLTRQTFLEKA